MRLITDIMRDIKKGRLVEEATAALAEVVRCVDELHKPGSVSITITVKPGDGNEKTLQATLSIKKPARDIPPAIFFSDDDGDLHRSDPRQSEMELAEVGRASAAQG
jgi:hypothetical protein